ncbi:MAG TPA: Mth938-like domain-containing protein, partial [Saliniramus sp.]|nr:Mth938-like domain-containing protein [Saliniramus sp.]
ALPSGLKAWDVSEPSQLNEAAFSDVLAEVADIELLLVGTGVNLVPLSEPLLWHLRAAGIRIDVMQTGAAARTFNILLAEKRRVAAALIAVE